MEEVAGKLIMKDGTEIPFKSSQTVTDMSSSNPITGTLVFNHDVMSMIMSPLSVTSLHNKTDRVEIYHKDAPDPHVRIFHGVNVRELSRAEATLVVTVRFFANYIEQQAYTSNTPIKNKKLLGKSVFNRNVLKSISGRRHINKEDTRDASSQHYVLDPDNMDKLLLRLDKLQDIAIALHELGLASASADVRKHIDVMAEILNGRLTETKDPNAGPDPVGLPDYVEDYGEIARVMEEYQRAQRDSTGNPFVTPLGTGDNTWITPPTTTGAWPVTDTTETAHTASDNNRDPYNLGRIRTAYRNMIDEED